jgi:hypothetical protein
LSEEREEKEGRMPRPSKVEQPRGKYQMPDADFGMPHARADFGIPHARSDTPRGEYGLPHGKDDEIDPPLPES